MSAVLMAWRVHDLASESIARVDAKAGFAATVQTAALAAAGVVAGSERAGSSVLGWLRWPILAGAGLLLAAVVLSVFVVLPTLTAPGEHAARSRSRGGENALHFGAITHLSADQLADRLIAEHELALVCDQAITLAGISERKHRLLRRSLQLSLAGSLCAVPFALGLAFSAVGAVGGAG